NHFLDSEIFQLSIVLRVLCFEHGDESAGTRDVYPLQSGVEFHYVGARWHGKVCDRFVSVERKDRECSVSAAEKKCTVMLRIQCHAMIELATFHGITC